jgi:hypothetical protein
LDAALVVGDFLQAQAQRLARLFLFRRAGAFSILATVEVVAHPPER